MPAARSALDQSSRAALFRSSRRSSASKPPADAPARPGAPALEPHVGAGDGDADGHVVCDRNQPADVDRGGELVGGGAERRRAPGGDERGRRDRGEDRDERERDRELGRAEARRVQPPNPLRYHATTFSPQKRPVAPPSARKGPNGIGSLRPRRPVASSTIARTPPTVTAAKSENRSAFQPRKAPSIAPSFASPRPMPSSRKRSA